MQCIKKPSHSDPTPIKHHSDFSVESSVASNHSISSVYPCKMSTSAPAKEACEWMLHTTDGLLDVLLQFYREGKTTGKALKEPLWNEVVVALFDRTKVQYTSNQIKDKAKRMKNEWSKFHQLIKLTKGVWNPNRMTIDIPNERLQEFKDNNELQRAQKKGLKRYDDMTEIWAEGTANGGFARSSNNAHMSVDEEREQRRTEYANAPATSRGWGGKTTYKDSSRTNIDSPYPSRSKSSSATDHRDLQCAVMRAILDQSATSASTGGSKPVWELDECLTNVRLLGGVTDEQVVVAGDLFRDSTVRQQYMSYTTKERLIWVGRYCK